MVQKLPAGQALTNNPFQGMGNVFFPFNMNLVPAFMIPALFSSGHVFPVLSFVIFAVELFLSTYLLGRMAGLYVTTVLTASWLMVILSLPFVWPPLLNSTYALVPNCIDVIMGQSVLFWAFLNIGAANQVKNFVGFCLLIAVPGYLILANPLVVIIIAPTVAMGFLFFLVSSQARRVFIIRLAAIVSCLAMLGIGGFMEFLLGNTLYTVPSFYADELMGHQSSLYHASLLFQSETFSLVSPALVLLSIPGAVIVAISGRGASRILSVLHLTLTVIAVCGGYAIITYLPGWRGPQMSYFEMSIWPTYCLFATVAVWTVGAALARAAQPFLSRLQVIRSLNHWCAAIFRGWHPRQRLALLLVAAVVLFQAIIAAGSSWVETDYPPAETSIIRILQSEIGLVPGSMYRGSVATFTGGNPSSGISWFDQHTYDATLIRDYGNDHRLVGLWHYGIPTLAEYSQYITPPLYLVLSRLMARPIDSQIRNIVVTTVVNVNLLQSLGVRYVITNIVLNQGLILRDSLHGVKDSKTLYLYELPSPNLGNYSPVHVIKVDDASQALTVLKRGMDFKTQVVSAAELPDKLVPATAMSMMFDRGEARIKAESPGTSLLLLPIQYSHCLQSSMATDSSIGIRVIRANLAQAGVVFSGSLDLVLRFRTGPFGNESCRLRDVEDVKLLNMQEAARQFPLVSASF